jgi:hypothetical protein
VGIDFIVIPFVAAPDTRRVSSERKFQVGFGQFFRLASFTRWGKMVIENGNVPQRLIAVFTPTQYKWIGHFLILLVE